ncbi:MAG: carbonic anhydrase [Thermodesulfobacteriales bacterium]|jgi:carbonic anhydrase|nr:MAG: carbonic anhydrase [Thermodesulfobacteriales bacterium]
MSDNSFSRRNFIKISGVGAIAAASLNLGGMLSIPEALADESKRPQNADEALQVLMEGNKRFVNSMKKDQERSAERRKEVVAGQNPFVSILACADSRVAPEIIFDQGIGDLFVVRVAGNIVNPTNYGIQGSLEYGALVLGTPLIMVLGHSGCGAVTGAIEALQKGTEFPGSINNIVQAIEPAVVKAKGEKGNLLHNSIISNVQIGVDKLNNSDPIISDLVKKGKVKVVGANYDLKTGEVKLIS